MGRPGGGFGRPRTPRPPPTPEQILALATKEHVPARIAKGELEGKMKCRVWRKLHAEEAKRFDQVYALMSQNPGLSLPDGFGVLQSGLSVADFLARKERTQRKAAVKQARGEVDDTSVSAFINGLLESKTELAVVLGERTVLDTLSTVEPISLLLTRSGRMEKLQVVMITRRSDWELLTPQLERDPKLAQKPANVARQPDKRPFSDPRPFLNHQGERVRLTLRNGIQLEAVLRVVGRFDLIVGEDGHEVFVPLHALVRFSPADGDVSDDLSDETDAGDVDPDETEQNE
jgi:sRNA-binding regulator protein Hfq